MKCLLLFGFELLLFTSCGSALSDTNATEKLLTGAYVRHIENEFSLGDDTLTIKPIQKHRDLFSIISRSGFKRIQGKVINGKEIKQVQTTGVWNEKFRQLSELKYGQVYFLSEDGQELLAGTRAYRRITP